MTNNKVTLATYVCSACGLEHKFATEPPLVCNECGASCVPNENQTLSETN